MFRPVVAAVLFTSLLHSAVCMAQTPVANPKVRSVYVASFGTKPGAETMREHLRSELKKLLGIRLVSDPAQADSVLGGSGEVWVKGHYSMNPRARNVTSDAHTLYSGYLSVEVKDRKEETLWSYLATPHAVSTDVYRDLAKVVARKFADSLLAESPH